MNKAQRVESQFLEAAAASRQDDQRSEHQTRRMALDKLLERAEHHVVQVRQAERKTFAEGTVGRPAYSPRGRVGKVKLRPDQLPGKVKFIVV